MIKKLFEFEKLKKVSNIAILGLLLSLRIILQFVGSISLGPTTLSFTWITLIVVGFIFGPFIGLMFGVIADLLGYVLHPGVYMWEYAIQEPLICFVAGIIGFIYFNYKSKKWLDFIIFEVFLIVFTTVALVVALIEHPDMSQAIGKSTRTSSASFLSNKTLPLILVPIFFVLINMVMLYLVINDKNNYRIILYVAMIVIQAWVIWSWIEGPWAQIKYWRRTKVWHSLNDSNRVALTMRWLFNIRVFKASFVVPIEIFVASSVMIMYKKLPVNQGGY